MCLRGRIGDRDLEFTLNVDSAEQIWSFEDSLPVHRLAAKTEIKQLQDNKENGMWDTMCK